jgi:signal transduction histidine kinase/ActR/RegA family two-component response regulator/PAS domain-containing protein
MRPKPASATSCALFAVAVTAAMIGLRWLLEPWLRGAIPVATLFPAVAASVWFGGYRPALLSTGLGYVACNVLFIDPHGMFSLSTVRDVVGCSMFLISAGIVIAFGEALRGARSRADVALSEAERMAHAGSWEWHAASDRATASDGALRIFGLPPGSPVPDFKDQDGTLFPHDSWMKLDVLVREALRSRRGYEMDLEAFRSGERIWVATRSEVMSDASGKVVGLRGTLQDITPRKRAEALEEAQRRILEKIARRVPLPEVLADVARVVEQQDHGLLCSIHVIDARGTHLKAAAGPSLPAEYMGAVEMVPIQPPDAGPCSLVMHAGKDVLVPDIAADLRWSRPWRDAALAAGLRSVRSTVVRAADGTPLATFAMYRRHAGDPEPPNLQVGFAARQLAAIAIERERDDADLRLAEADARLLQMLGSELIGDAGQATLYQQVVEGAARLMRSTFASLQAIEPLPAGGSELRLLACRGFSPQAALGWQRVRTDSRTICAEALRTRRRAVVPDVAAYAPLKGTDDLRTMRETGIVAVQSTPLVARTGRMVGMLSTQWNQVHVPPERDLRNLDILARQAADLIERKRNDEALRQADRRKDEFLATLAHELRNPLAPIRNSLTVMRLAERGAGGGNGGAEQGDGPARIDAAGVREVMERQVQHLIRLVDDLLDVSRITRGTMPLRREPVELAAVVRHALETCRPLAEGLQHEVIADLPEEPIWLNADPVRVTQVFNNLLNNACKYTDPKGHVWLAAERQGDEVVVRVRDSGRGIPTDRLATIFDMFEQVDRSLEKTQGGLGIGLTLVKRLVELHGGSVLAHSGGPGLGSEFVVRLPALRSIPEFTGRFRETAAAQPPPARPAGNGGPAPRVLVVDDNVDSADSLALLLQVAGSEARTARDGVEALETARDFRPDVVFLDIGMPRMNGYDAARRIREEPWGRDMLLVAMTGWGQEEDRRRSKDAGFDAHLVKPADGTEVMRLMERTRREACPNVE